jgi:hypothetical protein
VEGVSLRVLSVGSLALVLREVEEEVVAADPKVFPVA